MKKKGKEKTEKLMLLKKNPKKTKKKLTMWVPADEVDASQRKRIADTMLVTSVARTCGLCDHVCRWFVDSDFRFALAWNVDGGNNCTVLISPQLCASESDKITVAKSLLKAFETQKLIRWAAIPEIISSTLVRVATESGFDVKHVYGDVHSWWAKNGVEKPKKSLADDYEISDLTLDDATLLNDMWPHR